MLSPLRNSLKCTGPQQTRNFSSSQNPKINKAVSIVAAAAIGCVWGALFYKTTVPAEYKGIENSDD